MDCRLVLFIVAYVVTSLLASSNGARVARRANDPLTFNVLYFGAVGDGEQDDTQAFSKAWMAACNSSNKPTLVVPQGKTFLLKSIKFKGPCKSSSIHVSIQGNIVAPNSIDKWGECDGNNWLQFAFVDNLLIDGRGQIDGRGSIWWDKTSIFDHNNDAMIPMNNDASSCHKPTALRLQNCHGVQLRGLTHKNSAGNHISVSASNNSIISNLRIIAPEDAHNTDGIDISCASNVQVLNSVIGTGDDCIAIGSHSSYINITNIICGPGHGISVGSLGKDGAEGQVEEVHVSNCTFSKTMNGARIKTWQGGSGYARKITYDNIHLIDVNNPIIIDQFYCFGQCPIKPSAVAVSDVRFSGFQGTSASVAAITLNCSQALPCNNIEVANININPFDPTRINNVTSFCQHAKIQESLVVPLVNCLN